MSGARTADDSSSLVRLAAAMASHSFPMNLQRPHKDFLQKPLPHEARLLAECITLTVFGKSGSMRSEEMKRLFNKAPLPADRERYYDGFETLVYLRHLENYCTMFDLPPPRLLDIVSPSSKFVIPLARAAMQYSNFQKKHFYSALEQWNQVQTQLEAVTADKRRTYELEQKANSLKEKNDRVQEENSHVSLDIESLTNELKSLNDQIKCQTEINNDIKKENKSLYNVIEQSKIEIQELIAKRNNYASLIVTGDPCELLERRDKTLEMVNTLELQYKEQCLKAQIENCRAIYRDYQGVKAEELKTLADELAESELALQKTKTFAAESETRAATALATLEHHQHQYKAAQREIEDLYKIHKDLLEEKSKIEEAMERQRAVVKDELCKITNNIYQVEKQYEEQKLQLDSLRQEAKTVWADIIELIDQTNAHLNKQNENFKRLGEKVYDKLISISKVLSQYNPFAVVVSELSTPVRAITPMASVDELLAAKKRFSDGCITYMRQSHTLETDTSYIRAKEIYERISNEA